MKAEDLDYKVVSVVTGNDIVTSVNCSPAELLGIIQHLVGVFSDAAGIEYNQVLDDIKEVKDVTI
jgi:hypothetical protein